MATCTNTVIYNFIVFKEMLLDWKMRHRTSHMMEMNDKFRFLTDGAPGGFNQG